MNPDKNLHLQQAIDAIQKKWGNDIIHQAHQQSIPSTLPTGFSHLDNVLQGGVPRGRITEITGAPTSGTRTLALRLIAAAQKSDDLTVYIDLRHTFDTNYAAHCQVNLAELLLVRPQTPAEAFGILFDLIASRLVGLLVLDSPANLSPHERQTLAKVINRLHPVLASSTCVLLLLASPKETALTPHTAIHLRVTRVGWVYAGRDVCGWRAQVAILKDNRLPISQPVPIQIIFEDALAGGET